MNVLLSWTKVAHLMANMLLSSIAYAVHFQDELLHGYEDFSTNYDRKIINKKKPSISLQSNQNYHRGLEETDFIEIDASYSPSDPRSFAVGLKHVCVVNRDSQIICWGRNDFGQLGIGTSGHQTNSQTVPPVDLGEGRIPKEVYANGLFTCALFETDDLACWGNNGVGSLGIGTKAKKGLNPSDMGNNLQVIDFGAGRKVKQVALGRLHGCVILDNDSLKCWGDNTEGQLGYGDTNHRGDNANEMGDNLPSIDYGGGVLKKISLGRTHTCILFETNEAKCWGLNSYGQLGYGDKMLRGNSARPPNSIPMLNLGSGILDIQTGNDISCAMLDNKGIKCWGYNGYGNLGIGSTATTGGKAAEVGDGLPYANFGSGTVKYFSINGGSPCVILEDNSVKCWGTNTACTLGTGDSVSYGKNANTIGDKLPVIDFGQKTIILMQGLGQVICATFSDGSFSCWGNNSYGSLGQGNKVNRGCNPGDMGDNLPAMTMPCGKNSLSLSIGTESNSAHTSTEIMHLNQEKLVMKAREGYYSTENKIYNHNLCVPEGTYQVRIEHSLGNWSGSYEISFKGNLISQLMPEGYFWQDRHVFSSCSNETHCNDQFSCTADTCDVSTSTCHFDASFSNECRSYGSPSALVIRSVTIDSNTTSTLEELSKRFFGVGESFSMRSQFLACSYDKYDITPFTGNSLSNVPIINGTIDVILDETSTGESAGTVSNKILQKAANELGELSSQFDFIIVCLPPGVVIGDSPTWKAYAFVGESVSVYNDNNCIYPSVQMHELGHNLGLSHSNDEENYGDTSGMMGISYSLLDGPSKCFNAPKSLELRWYVDGDLTLDVNDLIGKEVHLVGVTDYLEKGFKSTLLKIINCENGYDYFLAFNRKTDMNSGTSEGGDEVLVTRRRIGNYYDDSKLIAKLEHLQKFTIYGLGPTGDWDLQIMPNIYLNDYPSFGRISFSAIPKQCLEEANCDDNNFCTLDECVDSNGEMICSNTPKSCSDCGAPIFLEVTTNNYPNEILWDIKNVQTKKIIKSSTYYSDTFSSYNYSDCFEYGMYLFSIYYVNSTNEFYQNATFKLSIGDVEIDDGNITDLIYAETIFTICSKDSDCVDYDGCTIDFCDVQTKMCNNSYIPLSDDCINCFWFEFNLTTDNFAEETKWNVFDFEQDALVESGDPYPQYFHAYGRRKAPTKAGRRKAPTKSGRRKAPTKSGRRKAPTRSSSMSLADTPYRNLDEEEEEDNDIFEAICLEYDIKFKFIITDSFGDGICCAEGEGSFAVTLKDKVVKRGGNFSSYEEVVFKFTLSEGNCEDNNPGTYFEYDPDINACLYYPVECSIYGSMVEVMIKSDIYADDTVWKVTQNNTVQMEGSMYELAYTEYKSEICLPYGSYLFTISDPPADGMAFCFENECGYELIVNNETVQTNDGSFGTSKSHVFGICISDEECNDSDNCTNDFCDTTKKICVYDQLGCSECGKQTVIIKINTDFLFSLTSWSLIETDYNSTIGTGGPFVKSYSEYQEMLCVATGTYIFRVSNSEGRGMILCKNNIDCGYSVKVNGETIIESDGSFEYEKSHPFVICDFDSDCENEDSCSVGRCNNVTKLCLFNRLPCTSCNKKGLKIVIDTDGNSTETSWNLLSSENASLISSGGKYAKSYTKYSFDECIPKGEYIYTIFDEGGNGLTSCFGNGTNCGFTVAIDGEVVVDNAGDFASELSYSFKLCDDDPSCNTVFSTFVPSSSPTYVTKPVHVEYLKIVSFATGFYHTCALSSKHLVYCWGDNSFGQLGYGDKMSRALTGEQLFSVNIGDSNEAKQIHSGAFHTCIVTTTGDMICWGQNLFGQLGIGSTFNIGSSNGEMGNALKKVNLGQGRKVTKVSLGYQHSCALLDTNELMCWGNNQFGQLGQGSTMTIGDKPNDMGENLTSVKLGTNDLVQDISLGTFHTCAIQSDEVKCWGKNSNSQLGYGDKLERGGTEDTMGIYLPAVNISATVVHISAGNSVTCVLTDDGRVKCFGYNKFGQLGYGDKLERGGEQNDMGDSLPFVDVGENQNITYITRGSYSICALSSNNTVKCWGFGLECSLGLGDNMDRFSSNDLGNNLPNIDFGGKKVKGIQMYHWHGCALFEDATISCWGYNRYGQLGVGHKASVGCKPEEMGTNLVPADLYDPMPWVLQVDSVSTIDFDQGIEIEYSVSKSFSLDQFSSTIYDKTCTTISNNTSVFIERSDYKVRQNESLDQATVKVSVDYTKLRSSEHWLNISNTKGAYEFCVVSELYFDNTKSDAITLAETMIISNVDFNGNFNITDIQVSKKDSYDLHEGSHFQLKACLCNHNHNCETEPMIHQDSDVLLCIHPHEELRVSKFHTVNFYQDGILKFKAVENGNEKLLTKTSIEGEYGVLQTRLIADFFRSPNPSAAHVTGEVYLDFRSHLSSRSLLENNQATFNVNIMLQKRKERSFIGYFNITFMITATIIGWHFSKKKAKRGDIPYSLVREDSVK